jgi:hypothetical protein
METSEDVKPFGQNAKRLVFIDQYGNRRIEYLRQITLHMINSSPKDKTK